MIRRLAIVGSGDLGQLIAHHASSDPDIQVVGFFDDWCLKGSFIDGRAILGPISELQYCFDHGGFDSIMIGIGYNHMSFRKSVFDTFFGKIPFDKIIHRSAYVDSSATIGAGCFILPGCTIDSGVVLGNNVLLNTSVTVAHDTKINAHSFIGPSVAIAGKSKIGECCILGINCTVIDNIVIGPNIRVGAGAVVLKNIEIEGMYAGVPAILKKEFNNQ